MGLLQDLDYADFSRRSTAGAHRCTGCKTSHIFYVDYFNGETS